MITIPAHIQGLIFDSDGTLVDTMPLHYQTWQELAQAKGVHFPEDLFYELAGAPSDKITEILKKLSIRVYGVLEVGEFNALINC